MAEMKKCNVCNGTGKMGTPPRVCDWCHGTCEIEVRPPMTITKKELLRFDLDVKHVQMETSSDGEYVKYEDYVSKNTTPVDIEVNQQEILEMAKEAGFDEHPLHKYVCIIHSNGSWVGVEDRITKFSKILLARNASPLDIEAERKLFEEWHRQNYRGLEYSTHNGKFRNARVDLDYEIFNAGRASLSTNADSIHLFNLCQEQALEIEQLKAVVNADKLDAERYNYLRTELGYVIGGALGWSTYCSADDKPPFDYLIDQAINNKGVNDG